MRRWLARWRGAARQPLIDRMTAEAPESDPLVGLLFENAPLACLIVDAAGTVKRSNAALRHLLGPAAAMPPGADAALLFEPSCRETIWLEIVNVLGGRQPAVQARPARLTRPPMQPADAPPKPVTVLVSADAIRGPAGEITGAALWFTDISHQAELEALLAQSQKLQAIGQLAGGIAHDFNNLLTAILGAADAIATRPGMDGETLVDTTDIQNGAMRGAALVRQLLAFGRQQTLQPRVLAVNEVIGDISALLKRLLGEKVRLDLELETPGRSVRADPTQLDQVLVNLAVNARDAMAAGGVLSLRSGHLTLYRPLSIGADTMPPGRYVTIDVADTGAGIPDDVLPRIFDPFFTTKRERGGTGLGLSTVHGIIRQTGGYLGVESAAGLGTTFRIYLPRWDQPDVAATPAPAAEAAPAASPDVPRTVLLVEDEAPVRLLATRSFERRGWLVLAADSGEAALAMLETAADAITAVVSDVVMPGMDGAALVRAVRARPGCANLPAILVSGYAQEVLRRDIAALDVIFLSKPYLPRDLVARLEAALSEPPAPPV